jgi:hypothetical protein
VAAGRAVARQQRRGAGGDARGDLVLDEAGAQAGQLAGLLLGEDAQGKAQEFVDVERARLVLGVEAIVLGAVSGAIDNPAFGQVLAPEVIAVAREQGVVEVEEGEAQTGSRERGGGAGTRAASKGATKRATGRSTALL